MRNVAVAGRRELEAHRLFDFGVTASKPAYKAIDDIGNKEWVIDVYLGPLDPKNLNILKDCLISPYARQLVTGFRQPVLLERSKQGKFTVVGRAKTMPSGAQTDLGSILEPTYHRIEYNLASLGLMFVADLDVGLERWGVKAWGAPGKPWRQVTLTDAFGNVVMGDGIDPADVPEELQPAPLVKTTTKHVVLTLKTWGPAGDAHALIWGKDPWGAADAHEVSLTT
jgi:hypothetical protein